MYRILFALISTLQKTELDDQQNDHFSIHPPTEGLDEEDNRKI